MTCTLAPKEVCHRCGTPFESEADKHLMFFNGKDYVFNKHGNPDFSAVYVCARCSFGLDPSSPQKITTGPYKEFEVISTYTSDEAVKDGFLMDVDLLKKYFPAGHMPIKYITTGVLEKGYWNKRCKNSVKLEEAGHNPVCVTCEVWREHHGEKLSCIEPTLNVANVLDLITQAVDFLNRAKNKDDWFYSGDVELPSGKKQKIYVEQNETGRFTILLPEEH